MKLKILALAVILTGCGGSDTNNIGAGPMAVAGLAVTSNRLISSYGTNMCTQYTGESCIFGGGQVVVFSDGSVFLLGNWIFQYSITGDSDTDQNSISAMFPATQTTVWLRLTIYAARGAGYKNMYLVYSRATDSVKLVHDTDGSGTVNAGDTDIAALSMSTW